MPRHASAAPADANLEGLLDVERRLEARVREAEHRATARAQAAREAADRVDGERREVLERDALREEQEDLEVHARALADIAREADDTARRLDSASDAALDRAARAAYAALLDGGAVVPAIQGGERGTP